MIIMAVSTPLPQDAAAKIGPGVRESLSHSEEAKSLSKSPSARVVIALEKPKTKIMTRMQQEIAFMQNRVRQSVDGDGFTSLRAFSSIPAMTGILHSQEAIDELALNPNVRKVDLDVSGSGSLSDSVEHIAANERHDYCNTGKGVVIAVLDSGVDREHKNLKKSIKKEACFADDDPDTDGGRCPDGTNSQTGKGAAEDDAGHGTFVTGVITSNGKLGGRGVAPDAKIVAVKVTYGPSFAGSFSAFSQILAGLDYIISNRRLRVKIVNMSLGTRSTFSGDCDDETSWTMAGADAVDTLRSQGISVFASAGNNDSDEMGAPACLSGVIAVGASDNNDSAAPFTNSNESTDMFAPGVSIESSTLNNGLTVQSGTSFAAPHAAACAALLIDSGDASSPGDIKDRLTTSDFTVARDGNTFPRIDCSPSKSTKGMSKKCSKGNKKDRRRLRGY